MRAFLPALVAVFLLGGCLPSSEDIEWKEVTTSSATAEGNAQSQTAQAIEQFLRAQGWNKRGGSDPGGSVRRWYESANAPGTRVVVDNGASRRCFNFGVFVDAKAPDASHGRAIESAFVSEFGMKPGWRVSPGMPCPVGG
jgi:hypothetical protein